METLSGVFSFMAHTYCKDIDITNPILLRQALEEVWESIHHRKPLIRLIVEELHLDNITIPDVVDLYWEHKEALFRLFTPYLSDLISTKSVVIPDIKYRTVWDAVSGKMRTIGNQGMIAKVLDHVAVIGLQPLFKRIGEHQYASIPGRGPLRGALKICKWLCDMSMRYYAKLDIRHCYESIDPQLVYRKIAARVKNPLLLYLVSTLLAKHDRGLAIGSYLSQWSCNYLLSDAYHLVRETLYSMRRDKRHNWARHVVFYMDDILILGSDKRHVKKVAAFLENYFKTELNLEVKPWVVRDLNMVQHGHTGFIDMMGYRCHRGFLTVRRKTWRKIRRRIIRNIRDKVIPASRARSTGSYFGYVKNALKDLLKDEKVTISFRKCSLAAAADRMNKSQQLRNDDDTVIIRVCK